MKFTESGKLFTRAQQIIPGGVNSPVRAFKSVNMNPLFISRGYGSKIVDVDGNEYIDYVGSWGPLILGHANEEVLEAVEKTVRKGTSFGAPTQGEVELAELIQEAIPCIEMVRLVNSGTEATMGAIRVARGYTGKNKIIKFEGCYHGSIDYLLVKAGSGATTLGTPDSSGVPDTFAEQTLLAEYNNLDSVQEIVDSNQGEIAAVIIEPVPGNMGMITPEYGFLQGLRTICDREGIVLIFDEVMTGFRVAYGGVQSLINVEPDLTILGKVIGGGFPMGAYGGRQDIMLTVAPSGPVYQAGTLSGNPVAVAAGKATLEILKRESPYADLNEKTGWLKQQFSDLFNKAGIPFQFNNMGGMFGFFFSEKPVRNYGDALKTNKKYFEKFFIYMIQNQIYIPCSPFESLFISICHNDNDMEKTISALKKAIILSK